MIVDGGSVTNVSSQLLIDKLNHPTFDHPHPYKLQLLNDGDTVIVKKRALITISFSSEHED